MDTALHLALRFDGPAEDSFSDGQLPLDFFDVDQISFPNHDRDEFSPSVNTPCVQDPPAKVKSGAVAKLETPGSVFTQLHEHSHRLRNVANAVIAVNRLSSAAKRSRTESNPSTPLARSSSSSNGFGFQSNFASDLQSPGRVFALLGQPGNESPGTVYARLESTGDVMANLEDDGKVLASLESTGEVYARLESTGDVFARRDSSTGNWRFDPAWLAWGGGDHGEDRADHVGGHGGYHGPESDTSLSTYCSSVGTPSGWGSDPSPRPLTRPPGPRWAQYGDFIPHTHTPWAPPSRRILGLITRHG